MFIPTSGMSRASIRSTRSATASSRRSTTFSRSSCIIPSILGPGVIYGLRSAETYIAADLREPPLDREAVERLHVHQGFNHPDPLALAAGGKRLLLELLLHRPGGVTSSIAPPFTRAQAMIRPEALSAAWSATSTGRT